MQINQTRKNSLEARLFIYFMDLDCDIWDEEESINPSSNR